MHPSLTDTPALSRRGLLKFSLGATAFLATAGLGASLSGCSSSVAANGFISLRDGDLLFLRALVPVMLDAPWLRKMPTRWLARSSRWTTASITCRRKCSNSLDSCSTCGHDRDARASHRDLGQLGNASPEAMPASRSLENSS